MFWKSFFELNNKLIMKKKKNEKPKLIFRIFGKINSILLKFSSLFMGVNNFFGLQNISIICKKVWVGSRSTWPSPHQNTDLDSLLLMIIHNNHYIGHNIILRIHFETIGYNLISKSFLLKIWICIYFLPF